MTPVSFESLSRQLVSCAISAATSMKENERPDLQIIVTKDLRMSIASVAETGKVVGADTAADADAGIPTTTMMAQGAWHKLGGFAPIMIVPPAVLCCGLIEEARKDVGTADKDEGRSLRILSGGRERSPEESDGDVGYPVQRWFEWDVTRIVR